MCISFSDDSKCGSPPYEKIAPSTKFNPLCNSQWKDIEEDIHGIMTSYFTDMFLAGNLNMVEETCSLLKNKVTRDITQLLDYTRRCLKSFATYECH